MRGRFVLGFLCVLLLSRACLEAGEIEPEKYNQALLDLHQGLTDKHHSPKLWTPPPAPRNPDFLLGYQAPRRVIDPADPLADLEPVPLGQRTPAENLASHQWNHIHDQLAVEEKHASAPPDPRTYLPPPTGNVDDGTYVSPLDTVRDRLRDLLAFRETFETRWGVPGSVRTWQPPQAKEKRTAAGELRLGYSPGPLWVYPYYPVLLTPLLPPPQPAPRDDREDLLVRIYPPRQTTSVSNGYMAIRTTYYGSWPCWPGSGTGFHRQYENSLHVNYSNGDWDISFNWGSTTRYGPVQGTCPAIPWFVVVNPRPVYIQNVIVHTDEDNIGPFYRRGDIYVTNPDFLVVDSDNSTNPRTIHISDDSFWWNRARPAIRKGPHPERKDPIQKRPVPAPRIFPSAPTREDAFTPPTRPTPPTFERYRTRPTVGPQTAPRFNPTQAPVYRKGPRVAPDTVPTKH